MAEQQQQQQQQQEEQSEQKKQNSGDEQKKKIKRGEDKVDRGMKVSKKGLIDTQSIAGTRDFLPRDMRIQRWLFGKFQSVARMFSFEEYDAPILEPVELYTRKGGEDITNQMYDFKDKSGLRVSLRPEMTPSLARLVLKERQTLLLPLKWYSIPQCWRYETMIRGRKREHYQWNMDIWGVQQVTAEAELLAAIVAFFKSVGLTEKDVTIRISSRKVLQSVLKNLKIPEDKFIETCIVVDKLDKLRDQPEKMYEEFNKIGLERQVTDDIIKGTESLKTLDDLAQLVGDKAEAVTELRTLFKLAQGYGYESWIVFDSTIVRGLAYYTGIVFEGFAKSGEVMRAICGGGRYDGILKMYGANQNIPACGFGFGDCVIKEILSDRGLVPELPRTIDEYIVPFSEEMRPQACQVATMLREAGKVVDIVMKKAKVSEAFDIAVRHGAKRIIFVAPEEWANGKVRVKYLGNKEENKDAEQFDVDLDKLVSFEKPVQNQQ